MKQLISLLIIILLVSCGNGKKEKPHPVSNKDSSAAQIDSQRLKELWKKNTESVKADSIRIAGVLKEALDLAYKNIKSPSFKKKFTSVPDGLYTVQTRLAMNNFFSKNFKHLIVHISQPLHQTDDHVFYEYVYIYLKQDSIFKKVVYHEQWVMTYVSDTLQDVNGDDLNDLLVNWYGSNGCCLKNFYNVYLFQPQTGTFSEGFEFINPTFSAKEKVIRGVEYGHPGETSMYKYKWNGLRVDTLEYIYFEKNNEEKKTGKVIRKSIKEERLNQAPAEYRKIYGYDWFLGKV